MQLTAHKGTFLTPAATFRSGGSALEGRGEKPVGTLPVRPQAKPLAGVQCDALIGEQAGAGKRPEPGVRGLEGVGDGIVLLMQYAAGGVDQPAARPEQPRRGAQDAELLARELLDGPRAMPPLQVRVAPQRSEAAARRVDQHAVELAGKTLRAGVVLARKGDRMDIGDSRPRGARGEAAAVDDQKPSYGVELPGKPPQVEVIVTDAAGNVVRKFEAPARKKVFEFDFADVEIKGRAARGITITKYPIRKVDFLKAGSSTLSKLNLWYDADSGRLNKDQRGKYLGKFDGEDMIIAFMRTIVGVPTLGTFMPILIAIAFICSESLGTVRKNSPLSG